MATRRVLFDPADPFSLEPEQRQREIVAILAAGAIRMRELRTSSRSPGRRSARSRTMVPDTVSDPDGSSDFASSSRHAPPKGPRFASCMSQISPESNQTGLELSGPTCPDGPCG